MRKISFLTFLLLGVTFVSLEATAQKGKTTKSTSSTESSLNKTVLATIGKEPITYGELEYAFHKNMGRRNTRLVDIPRDSIMDFLQLYIKYRLKVQDALDRKLDKDSIVMADIAQNRRLLAETHYSEKKIVEPAVERILDRRKREIQIAIIVCITPEKGDTNEAYQRANRILGMVRGGADFEKTAKDSSEDTETGKRGGVLPYITGGKIIRPVEDAAYSGKPGEIYPQVVRYRGNYFVIKVLKNEPRMKVRASHLLLSSIGKNDSLAISKKGDSLLALIKAHPAKFEEYVRENSDDKTTKDKGGFMGSYYTRSSGFDSMKDQLLLPEFEKALFALKDGEISGKVWTEYGLHIIRRDSSNLPNIEEERESVKKDYKRLFYEEDKRNHLDSIREAFGYRLNSAVLKSFLAFVDTNRTTIDSAWSSKLTQGVLAQQIYSTPKGNMTVSALVDSLHKRSDLRATPLNYKGIIRVFDKFMDPKAVSDATANLENQYPDFALLMRDFRDGILLFKVEEQEVWGKLKFDSLLAHNYYDTTKARYRTDTKYEISEIYLLSDSAAKAVRKRVDGGEKFDDLAGQLTEREGFREKKGHHNLASSKEDKLVALAEKAKAYPGDIIGPEPYDRGFSIIRVNEVAQPRQKSFEEAIPDFAPAFQDMVQKRLTEQWITRVKQHFPVEINQKNCASVFKK
jgi:peptidyl-prolyl cis-trans isomerase SurA